LNGAGDVLKNINPKNLKDPSLVLKYIKNLEKKVEQPLFDLEKRQDVQVKFRVDENVAPAMFKADPLIPGGYIANSLTIRAMRNDLFIFGEGTEDLESVYLCACGKDLDVQFWKCCPYCSRDLRF
jgi:hypothetical protein